MRLLRLIMVLCLSLSLPVTTLAMPDTAGHCHTTAATAPAEQAADPHAAHMASAEAHQHDTSQLPPNAAENGCDCDCACASTQCATSCTALGAVAMQGSRPATTVSQHPAQRGPTHALAAHAFDILRPPCLA